MSQGSQRRRGPGAIPALMAEQVEIALGLARWVVLGAGSGVLAGLASYAFLESLDRATEARIDAPWVIWLLPVFGLALGLVQHHVAGRASQGSALLIDEIHEPTAWLPRRMAPLVFVGTALGHLFGASVGREGAALQISGSLTDLLSRTLRLDGPDRRVLLIAALAGGFGAMFGVPLAGAVFALEVQAVGRVRYEALVPALTAAVVGDLVVVGLGRDHVQWPQLEVPVDGVLLAKVALAGLVFGLVASGFTLVTHTIRDVVGRSVRWPPARLVLGGVATLALVALVGRAYLGLSLPLAEHTLLGGTPGGDDFALKALFTAVALGCGYVGGEMMPLFVIGATLGGALAGPLGLEVPLLAAVGYLAVFAGAANTPLACTIMGAELFGGEAVVAVAVGCVVAYITSSHQGIYATQRIDTHKRGRIVG